MDKDKYCRFREEMNTERKIDKNFERKKFKRKK